MGQVKICATGQKYYLYKDYLLDKNGDAVFPGDYVKVTVPSSHRPRRTINRRVKYIHNGCFYIRGEDEDTVAVAEPDITVRVGRYHPYHHGGKDKRHPRDKYLTPTEKENTEMLHLAIRVPETWGYADIINSINNFGNGSGKMGEQFFHGVGAIAASNTTELKQRVTDRIRANPDERWLLLSGNNVMEIDSPPVRCRQW